MAEVGTIERAFQLAPACGSLAEIKRKLVREGYVQVEAHLAGRKIRAELIERLNGELKQPQFRRR